MLASAALQLIALRDLVLPESFDPGQFQPGYFEGTPDRVSVRAGGELRTYMLPDLTLDDDGAVRLPPGRLLVVPVRAGASYAVGVLEAERPAYVALGTLSPPGAPGEPSLFEHGRVLDQSNGGPAWRDWNAGAPWKEDAAWLARLDRSCGPAQDLVLAFEGPSPSLQLGRCTLPLAAADGDGDRLALAVVSGPEWLRLERRPAAWSIGRHAQAAPVLFVGLAALAFAGLWWRLSPANALSVPAVLALISLGFAPEALLGWLIALLIAVCALLWVSLRWIFRRRLRVALGAAALVALAVAGGLLAPPPESHACVVTGYSNVNGVGLRPGVEGLFERVDATCAPCAGRSVRHAWSGGEFQTVEAVLCGDDFPAERGGRVIFMGGNNDDHFSGMDSGGIRNAHRMHHAFMTSLKRTRDLPLEQLPHSVERSLSVLEDQRATLRSALGCTAAHDAELLFLHNFLVTDLPAGRPPARRTMLDARRAEVEAAGGSFVDLIDAFGDEPGVAWFADFVHFSEVGHRRVSGEMCAAVEKSLDGIE